MPSAARRFRWIPSPSASEAWRSGARKAAVSTNSAVLTNWTRAIWNTPSKWPPTFAWNATGFPVAALPAGLGARSGLPVGVSLIGPRGAEVAVVQAGIDLQEHALAPPVVPYATP